jgi:malate/lactate dehydrogenase
MKIGIVGSGMVGSTSAFALVMNGVGRKIVLVDRTGSRAEANAGDTILVVVSNPVDIMTHLAAHFAAGSGMPFTRQSVERVESGSQKCEGQ